MKEINEGVFNKLLQDKDEDISKIANDLLNLMFEYSSILSEGLGFSTYDIGDRNYIQMYDTHRRFTHDSIITKINVLNRYCKSNNYDLLLETDNMIREDIGDAVVMYCNVCQKDTNIAQRLLNS